jgi:hypothetical protein
MRSPAARLIPWVLLLGLGLPGCMRTLWLEPPRLDPSATFSAYRTHDGFTIARAEGGKSGTIDPEGWSGWAPSFHVVLAGTTIAELRLASPAHVEIRDPGNPSAPLMGEIVPSWEDGAIRLTMRAQKQETLHTRSFRRTETTSGLAVLTRNTQITLDLRGTYRGEVRDDSSLPNGWYQVGIWEPSGRRVYESNVPRDFSVAEAAAVAVALDSEVDFIRRTASNAYRGAGGTFER